MVSLLFVSNGCNKNPDDPSFNIFTIEDDKTLGLQVKTEIENNPSQYPLLDESTNQAQYTYIRAIVTKILDAGKVYYKDEFPWEVRIIKDDNIVNAFCVPGGYMYVYTGLIKYLDSEDELAGVMGHEMAHADRRHTTDQMTKDYGIQLLFQIVLGQNQGAISQLAANLLTLKYSRNAETEADEYAVTYICPTDWKADGFKNFFQKLEDDGGGGSSDFFSTHPSPEKRVIAITDNTIKDGCTGNKIYDTEYANFKNSL